MAKKPAKKASPKSSPAVAKKASAGEEPQIIAPDGKRVSVKSYLAVPSDDSFIVTPEGKRIKRKDYKG